MYCIRTKTKVPYYRGVLQTKVRPLRTIVEVSFIQRLINTLMYCTRTKTRVPYYRGVLQSKVRPLRTSGGVLYSKVD